VLHTFFTKLVKVKKVCPHASYNELPEVVLRGEAGRQPNSLLILCIMAAMTTLGVLISVYYHLVYRQAGHAHSLALQKKTFSYTTVL
jgi:hypothetical protein